MPAANSKLTSSPTSNERSRASLVDEFGELDRQLALLEPRYKALSEEINGWFENAPAAEPATIDGAQYRLALSPKRLSRHVTKLTVLFRKLGVRRFLQSCTFPVGECEKLLGEDGAAAFIEGGRTGKRTITAMPLAQPEKAA